MRTCRFEPLTLREILPHLRNVKQRGKEYQAACPVCESSRLDGHHLHITEENGKVLAHCKKCESKLPDVIKALGIKGKKIEKPTVIEEYDHEYKNPDGSIAYYKHRVKYSDGSKDFRFGYIDESGKTVFKKPDGCNNLYNRTESLCYRPST